MLSLNYNSYCQDGDSYYKSLDVFTIEPEEFNTIKNQNVVEWTGNDGNKYAMKNNGSSLYTGIKINDKWVRHGVFYAIGNSYDKRNIEFIREKSFRRFGEIDGLRQEFSLNKEGKPYIKSETNYTNGIKNGKFISYSQENIIGIKGEYEYGFKINTWNHYYFDSKSILYTYEYDNCKCIRYGYKKDDKAAEIHKKGRKQTELTYLVKIIDKETLNSSIVPHGYYKRYNDNGTDYVERKNYKGHEDILSNCQKALQVREILKNPKLIAENEVKEILTLIYGKDKVSQLNTITDADIEYSKQIFNELLKQSCIMKYFSSIAKEALNPLSLYQKQQRAQDMIKNILEQLLEDKLNGCSKKDITKTLQKTIALKFKSKFDIRLQTGHY